MDSCRQGYEEIGQGCTADGCPCWTDRCPREWSLPGGGKPQRLWGPNQWARRVWASIRLIGWPATEARYGIGELAHDERQLLLDKVERFEVAQREREREEPKEV